MYYGTRGGMSEHRYSSMRNAFWSFPLGNYPSRLKHCSEFRAYAQWHRKTASVGKMLWLSRRIHDVHGNHFQGIRKSRLRSLGRTI
jgi:hypothetical protein